MKTLVCNAGSSSLKFSLFEAEGEQLLAEGSIDWASERTQLVFQRTGQPKVREELTLRRHGDAIARILHDLRSGAAPALRSADDLQAVGQRVVHGGDRYTTAVRITPEVKRAIGELAELAPLHAALFLEANPIPVKRALHRLGLMVDGLRLPLTPLGAMGDMKLARVLQAVLPMEKEQQAARVGSDPPPVRSRAA